MPLKLKFGGSGDNKRTKSSTKSSPTKAPSDHRALPSTTPAASSRSSTSSARYNSASVDSVPGTPPSEDSGDYSSVFSDAGSPSTPGSNILSPLGSPQSAPETTWPEGSRTSSLLCQREPAKRRPKSVSAPLHPEELGVRTASSKESKPGRNRAFSVSRSGKFKEAKKRTSLLELQDRFDKASRDVVTGIGPDDTL